MSHEACRNGVWSAAGVASEPECHRVKSKNHNGVIHLGDE